MTSELFQHVAMMSRLQADMANIFSALPAPIKPAALEGQDAQLDPKHSSVTDLPYVATNTGD